MSTNPNAHFPESQNTTSSSSSITNKHGSNSPQQANKGDGRGRGKKSRSRHGHGPRHHTARGGHGRNGRHSGHGGHGGHGGHSGGHGSRRQNNNAARPQVNVAAPAGRKASRGGNEVFNPQDLLNFRYEEPQQFRQTKSYRVVNSTPFDKRRHVQASFQFLVSSEVNPDCQHDPNIIVAWKNIQLVYSVRDSAPSCPICFEPPTAGKITQCGHVFCAACILHYLSVTERNKNQRCPLCFEQMSLFHLKSYAYFLCKKVSVNGHMSFAKLERSKESINPRPHCSKETQAAEGIDPAVFHRIEVCEDIEPILAKEEKELHAYLKSPDADEADRVFVSMALRHIQTRRVKWLSKERDQSIPRKPLQIRCLGKDLVAFKNPKMIKKPKKPPCAPETEVAQSALSWSCGVCTFKNQPHRKVCEMCATSHTRNKKIPKSFSQQANRANVSQSSILSILQTPSQESHAKEVSTKSADSKTVKNLRASAPAFVPASNIASLDWESMATDTMISSAPPDSPTENVDPFFTSTETQNSLQVASQENKTGKTHNVDGPFNDDPDSCYFYQAADGQRIYLHVLNYSCLRAEFGSALPPLFSARVLNIVDYTMEQKQFTYLSHLPSTSSYRIAFLELSHMLSDATKRKYGGRISKFKSQLAQRAREQRRVDKDLARRSQDDFKQSSEYTYQYAPEHGEYNYQPIFWTPPDMVADFPDQLGVVSSGADSPSALSRSQSTEVTQGWSNVATRGLTSVFVNPTLGSNPSLGSPLVSSMPVSLEGAWTSPNRHTTPQSPALVPPSLTQQNTYPSTLRSSKKRRGKNKNKKRGTSKVLFHVG